MTRLLKSLFPLLAAICLALSAAEPKPETPLGESFQEPGPTAEVVPLPPSWRSQQSKPSSGTKKAEPAPSVPVSSKSATVPPAAVSPLAVPAPVPAPTEPGFATVITGKIEKNLILAREQSPVLFKGTVIIPAGISVDVKSGVFIHFRADANVDKSAAASTDPEKGSVLWVWGSLNVDALSGDRVEFINDEKTDANILMYGAMQSRIDGARIHGLSVAQSGGTCLWANCEMLNVKHYALAAGVGIFTHCTLRNCGGIFATYNVAPWSLMMRKNSFENCREGVILGSTPGEARLIVEKNNFVRTRGATLRVMPVSEASAAAKNKNGDLEILIGENWFGTALEEEIDMRIADHRADPSIHANINTRPPAQQAYAKIGAGVSESVIAATLHEQQLAQQNLLKAHLAQQKKWEKAPSAGVAATDNKN